MRFQQNTDLFRGPRPGFGAATDGLDPVGYSAYVVQAPANGWVNVKIPGIDADMMYSAHVGGFYGLAVGDEVLVVFDDTKTPWVVVANVVGPPRAITGSMSGTFANVAEGQITTTSWQLDNGMTVSGNGVVVPIAGYYFCTVQATIQPISGGGGYIQPFIYINGVVESGGTATSVVPANSTYQTGVYFAEANLAAGAVIVPGFFNAAGVSVSLNGGIAIIRYTGQ